ncbi:hypothetical protein Cgig2_001289 [Carnegiea gigantea]|uniref:Uncharacterized protein n=1 Tax=Carnegiea gigantea TaxID=171969 RepID=A0A9Q1KNH2_9CARY|nr:hypothetical protein Cgig2_001289 [Carnegiea gigantea]
MRSFILNLRIRDGWLGLEPCLRQPSSPRPPSRRHLRRLHRRRQRLHVEPTLSHPSCNVIVSTLPHVTDTRISSSPATIVSIAVVTVSIAKANEEDLNMVVEVCKSLKKKLTISGEEEVSKLKDLESFVGCNLPKKVEIHPPKQSTTKGSGKRIKGGKEEAMEQKRKHPRHCTSCGQYAYHDRRNCPAKDQNNVFQ